MKPLLAIAGLGLLLWSLVFLPFTVDDAYISARYAGNLCDGIGLTFNQHGPPVEGFSNLVWTLLLTPFSCTGSDPTVAFKLLGFLSVVASAFGAFYVVRGVENRRLGAAAVALTLGCPAVMAWAFGGLEAPLLAACLMGGIAALESTKRGGIAVGVALFAIASVVRVDAVGVVAVYLLVRGAADGVYRTGRMRRAAVALGVVAGTVAMVVGWRMTTYGYPLPNTAYAKVDLGGVALSTGLRYVASAWWAWWMLLVVPAPFLVPRAQRPLVLAMAATVVAQVAYTAIVGGDWMPMHRFLVPVVPVAAATVVLGLGGLRARLGEMRASSTVDFVALAAFLLGIIGFSGSHQAFEVASNAWHVQRYVTLGEYLSDLPPNATVAMSPAGAAPYFSHRDTIDMLGLNDVHIARAPLPHGPVPPSTGHARGDARYVLDQEPTVIVLSGGARPTPSLYTSEAGLLFDPRFAANYVPQQLPAPSSSPAFTFPAVLGSVGEDAGYYRCQRAGLIENCASAPGPDYTIWYRNPAVAAQTPSGRLATQMLAAVDVDDPDAPLRFALENQQALDQAGIGLIATGWIARLAHLGGRTAMRDEAIAAARNRGEHEWMLFEYWLWTEPDFDGLFAN